MAIFKVQMLAFNPPEWENPRLVEVPDEMLDGPDSKILELIYYYGQNDFQPRKCCSVSVGDVAELAPDKFFICKPFGWAAISAEDLEKYKALDRRERQFSSFVYGE